MPDSDVALMLAMIKVIIDEERMLVTTTRSWMATMSKDDVAVCSVADCAPLNGKTASKEIGFHAAILRERAEVNVVLHFQSPYATTVACRKQAVESFFLIPEIPYYIGTVATVPFLAPGSAELAEAVAAAIKQHDLAILRNHGQVTVADTLDGVIERAAYFELACKIIIGAGGNVQPLSKEAAAALGRSSKRLRDRA